MRARAASLGTASVKLRPVVWRRPSKLPKKNVLLCTSGPAKRSAELAQAQLLLLVVVLAGRVERVVAEVVEQRAAEAVAAALADHGDVAARAEAAFGRRQARVHAELGHRLHRRLQPELRAGRVQVARARIPHIRAVDAVVVQVVLLVRLAVEAHARPAAVAVGGRAGRQRHQVREVAPVDRQVLHFLGRHVHADLGRRHVQRLRRGGHRDLLGQPANAERDVDGLDVADAERPPRVACVAKLGSSNCTV